MDNVDKEWWLKLAEEICGKSLEDSELTLKFGPVKENEEIIIHDLLKDYGLLMGIKFVSLHLMRVWKDAPSEVPAIKMKPIKEILLGLEEVFWGAIRFRFPKAEALGIRMHEGKFAIVQYPEKANPLEEIFSRAFKVITMPDDFMPPGGKLDG